MNLGIATKRYATALLRFTRKTGGGERVCMQALGILRDPHMLPDPMAPELERFVALLAERKRTDKLPGILRAYVDMYCEDAGLKHVVLTSSVKSQELEDRVRASIQERSGCRVILESLVDPALVGGFRIEFDGLMLDASVQRQLEQLRRQFTEKNNRIV